MSTFHVACGWLSPVITIVVVILVSLSLSELNISQFTGIEKCGIIEPVPGDARTLMPWNIAIFKRTKSDLKFITSGVLISPSAALVVFRGVYGDPPGKGKRYYIPPAESFLVVAGLNSTSLRQVDRYTQFAEVSYILPYNGHEEGNQNFHFWLYHLTKPLNFSTPYVKAPCLPFFLRGLPSSWRLRHGGFVQATTSSSGEPIHVLKVSDAKALSDQNCDRIFKKKYVNSTTSEHIWCSGLQISRDDTDQLCLTHGSVLVANLLHRYFLAGVTALIPDLQSNHGRCNQHTVYLNARIQSHYEWLVRNTNCGPHQFSCYNTTCLPLSSVCNRVPNCPGEDLSDEDPIFCNAQNRCKGPQDMSCGLNGKCLAPHKICDGNLDCDDRSDEAPQICSLNASALPTISAGNDRNSHMMGKVEPQIDIRRGITPIRYKRPWECLPLPVSEGTVLQCQHHETNETIKCEDATENTVATLSCDKYYSPKFKVSTVQMRCTAGGNWMPFRRFACEANCGILTTEVTSLITHAMEANRKNAFPWYAAIFRETQPGRPKFHCGASLIEKNVILTAAHCVEDIQRQPYTLSQFKVVLAPVSSNFEDNVEDQLAEIHTIKQVRIPLLYDFKQLMSDIAIVELSKPVGFSRYIRPVCYLYKNSLINPNIDQLGKVAGFGYDETGEISYALKYANLPIVSPLNCQRLVTTDLPSSTFCAGYNNGTALCNGDSGGGIVFVEKDSNYERYYLKGVVSAGASSQPLSKSCSADRYSIFTNVDAFRRWILETLEAIEA
ncbi:unnamed protein product [Allacma fusca]|uniref:Peptidase S1 domain-containing protein n=1 Tax=Allacma fusca TaxID=39272 RepID=A0A8J2J5R4_9HEXA|nr:unnamed protein product [Allacma fusca]